MANRIAPSAQSSLRRPISHVLPVCLDLPDIPARRLGYALDELLRGLGMDARPVRRDDARIVVSPDPPATSALRFQVGLSDVRRPVRLGDLGWMEIAGEQWPLPVGSSRQPAADPSGLIDADVLGSAFWWLAGVQEATTVARDRHGRFSFAHALQNALAEAYGPDSPGTVERPAVDAYRQWLAGALRQLGIDVPGRTWGGAPWAVALTHDVDALNAGRLRGLLGESLRGRPLDGLRRAVGRNDRRESLEALLELARQHGAQSTVFIKAGSGAPEDVPYALHGRTRSWLQSVVSESFEVGLHPSYAAADHPRQLEAEHRRLASVLGTAPMTVRTHFLRWIDPVTLRLIESQGFEIDSTLGFSEAPGFRRGTAHPFRLYDLHVDRVTDLWEMPLAVMDTTVFDHQHLSEADALATALTVCDAARESGGVAVLLWHSYVGGDASIWRRRLVVLEAILRRAQETGAAIGPLRALLDAWCSTPSSTP